MLTVTICRMMLAADYYPLHLFIYFNPYCIVFFFNSRFNLNITMRTKLLMQLQLLYSNTFRT
jgi:hypothetical protein